VTRGDLSMNTGSECTLNVLRSRRHCENASAAISSKSGVTTEVPEFSPCEIHFGGNGVFRPEP
jgi:hypothetical protein